MACDGVYSDMPKPTQPTLLQSVTNATHSKLMSNVLIPNMLEKAVVVQYCGCQLRLYRRVEQHVGNHLSCTITCHRSAHHVYHKDENECGCYDHAQLHEVHVVSVRGLQLHGCCHTDGQLELCVDEI